MGVESTAILLRWLLEAACRGFPLDRLIVITAQVGGESKRTKWLAETFVLPLLRRFNIRYVQVCRAGPSQKDGIIVLSDTRQPEVCHTEGGPYTMEHELIEAGTVVQCAAHKRTCSRKWKGFPLDSWLRAELDGAQFIQVFGFACDEGDRVQKDESYSVERWGEQKIPFYPLVEWGWDRERCISYLLDITKTAWSKSACAWCVFARKHIIASFRDEPEQALRAMRIERQAQSLNSNQTMFPKGGSVIADVLNDGNAEAERLYREYLAETLWALYEVRRVFNGPANADRKLTTVQTGTRAEVEAALAELAVVHSRDIEEKGEYRYLYLQRRPELPKKRRAPRKKAETSLPAAAGKGRKAKRCLTDAATAGGIYPFTEHLFTIAPAVSKDKERDRFATAWQQATSPIRQMSLLPLAA